MKLAKYTHNMNDLFNGDCRVYSLSEPYHGYNHVMVQAMTDTRGEQSTCIFGSDSTGNPDNWNWLEGSVTGELNHNKALERAGYSLTI